MKFDSKLVKGAIAAWAVFLLPAAALAGSEFSGTWKVQDTSGAPFEITLTDAGEASATRSGEGMKGSWTEEGSAAVIKWDTGWTTKITKEGGSFTKTAFEQGKAVPKEGNTSPAEKVK
jgi:hypothetical protein